MTEKQRKVTNAEKAFKPKTTTPTPDIQGGYEPTTGELGDLPTEGSGVDERGD